MCRAPESGLQKMYSLLGDLKEDYLQKKKTMRAMVGKPSEDNYTHLSTLTLRKGEKTYEKRRVSLPLIFFRGKLLLILGGTTCWWQKEG